MDTLTYKTRSLAKEEAKKEWVLVDAEGQILGRLASKIAMILRGKNKPSYTPHVDCGDYVVIINAEKVRFTGKKLKDKDYVSYTGFPGGQRHTSPQRLLEKHPERILEFALHGMLPKTRLGNQMRRNLFIYAGTEHPHAAQQPKPIKL